MTPWKDFDAEDFEVAHAIILEAPPGTDVHRLHWAVRQFFQNMREGASEFYEASPTEFDIVEEQMLSAMPRHGEMNRQAVAQELARLDREAIKLMELAEEPGKSDEELEAEADSWAESYPLMKV